MHHNRIQLYSQFSCHQRCMSSFPFLSSLSLPVLGLLFFFLFVPLLSLPLTLLPSFSAYVSHLAYCLSFLFLRFFKTSTSRQSWEGVTSYCTCLLPTYEPNNLFVFSNILLNYQYDLWP